MKKMTTKDSFLGNPPRFVPAGSLVDVENVSGKEKNLADVPGGVESKPVVAIAPITVTGPHPTQPQQIPPGTAQTAGGGYETTSAKLVGAGHPDAEDLMGEGDTEEELKAALAEGSNGDAKASNEGTVNEIVAKFGGMTDEQLDQLKKAEANESKPRKSLISAVDDELEKRKS